MVTSDPDSGSFRRPEDERDDRALLSAHVAGDTAAFDELVRRHRDRLWGVALRTLGDREDAADAVQDALISAYRRAGTFRGESAVTTWLHRITVNACLDLVRRKNSRPSVSLGDHDIAAVTDELETRETALTAVAALRQLPIEQTSALVLVDVESFSVAEAAAMLGVAEGTVKSRCARGRARLAQILSPVGNDRPGGRVGTNESGTREPGGER